MQSIIIIKICCKSKKMGCFSRGLCEAPDVGSKGRVINSCGHRHVLRQLGHSGWTWWERGGSVLNCQTWTSGTVVVFPTESADLIFFHYSAQTFAQQQRPTESRGLQIRLNYRWLSSGCLKQLEGSVSAFPQRWELLRFLPIYSTMTAGAGQ